MVRPVRVIEKRRRGQERTGQSNKKSQRRYILPSWGEASTQPICTKICTVVAVCDVITCAKFGSEISGVTILQGVEFSVFLLNLAWALQQCSTNVRHHYQL